MGYVTRVDVMAYVAPLSEEMREVFEKVDRYVLVNNDTLDESMQMAMRLVQAFAERAAEVNDVERAE